MDVIQKALVFGDLVTVSVLSLSESVAIVSEKLKLSDLAKCAVGRLLTIGSFMTAELKGKGEKLSIVVNGGGGLGQLIFAGDEGLTVRATCHNPEFSLEKNSQGKENLRLGVGNNGNITVMKDLGLKEPYVAKTQIANGELSEDFAWYYANSEQRPMAIALDAVCDNGICTAGGIIIEPLPNCPEYILTIIEDICMNFADFSSLLKKFTPLEIIEEYFGHFEIEYLEPKIINYRCKCDREVMEGVLLSLGRNECVNLLMERGEIEITCDFCNTKYIFSKQDVIDIWRRYDNRL